MADVEKLMGVSADDIEKIMGVAASDIEKVMGLGIVTATFQGSRVLIFSGENSGDDDVIDYKAVTSNGNCSDFGDISVSCGWVAAFSNGSRGVAHVSRVSFEAANILEYVTIGTTGDSSDFGDVTVARQWSAASSNGIVGIVAGGHDGTALSNVMDYVTIASTGNATDWGDLGTATHYNEGVSVLDRALFNVANTASGASADVVVAIDYVLTASTGNASDFGDLVVSRYGSGACESATRGIWMGGEGGWTGSVNLPRNQIDYIALASTGDASDFGDMTDTVRYNAGSGNGTRGESYGGNYPNGPDGTYGEDENIEYITIASTGNATDAGDLTVDRKYAGACSGT